jgi:hypothetical protein
MKGLIFTSTLLLIFSTSSFEYKIKDLNCDKVKKVKEGILCILKPSRTDINIDDSATSGRFIRKRLGFGHHIIGFPTNYSKTSPFHIHFGGSYGKPYIPVKDQIRSLPFLREGMKKGRLMIQLAYDNQYSVNLDQCSQEGKTIDNCAGLIRERKQTGKPLTNLTNTDRDNSINNRLHKLFKLLKKKKVISPTKDLSWNKLEVSGHSQGGGQSLFIAKRYGVKRACLIAGGYDLPDLVNPSSFSLADWIIDNNSKTPLKNITALVHTDDKYYDKFSYVYKYLGLYSLGNVYETSRTDLTNQKGDTISNMHGGIMSARELSKLRAQACF